MLTNINSFNIEYGKQYNSFLFIDFECENNKYTFCVWFLIFVNFY